MKPSEYIFRRDHRLAYVCFLGDVTNVACAIISLRIFYIRQSAFATMYRLEEVWQQAAAEFPVGAAPMWTDGMVLEFFGCIIWFLPALLLLANWAYFRQTPILHITKHEMTYLPGMFRSPRFISWQSVREMSVANNKKVQFLFNHSSPFGQRRPCDIGLVGLCKKERLEAVSVMQEMLEAAKAEDCPEDSAEQVSYGR